MFALLLVFAGCGDRAQTNKLDLIDSLATTDEYDSAYALFRSIDPNSISDDEEQAFYGILQMQLNARYDIILETIRRPTHASRITNKSTTAAALPGLIITRG